METLEQKSSIGWRNPKNRCFAVLLAGISCTSLATASQAAVESFIAHPEFCAYMASPHDSRNEDLEARFDAAMKAAISSIQRESTSPTQTEAIFLIKARCDHALSQLGRYSWQTGRPISRQR